MLLNIFKICCTINILLFSVFGEDFKKYSRIFFWSNLNSVSQYIWLNNNWNLYKILFIIEAYNISQFLLRVICSIILSNLFIYIGFVSSNNFIFNSSYKIFK